MLGLRLAIRLYYSGSPLVANSATLVYYFVMPETPTKDKKSKAPLGRKRFVATLSVSDIEYVELVASKFSVSPSTALSLIISVAHEADPRVERRYF